MSLVDAVGEVRELGLGGVLGREVALSADVLLFQLLHARAVERASRPPARVAKPRQLVS